MVGFAAASRVLTGVWAVAFIAAVWIGIELGPALVARLLTRRAERSGEPASPFLFGDPEAERRARIEKHLEDTSGNPTLR